MHALSTSTVQLHIQESSFLWNKVGRQQHCIFIFEHLVQRSLERKPANNDRELAEQCLSQPYINGSTTSSVMLLKAFSVRPTPVEQEPFPPSVPSHPEARLLYMCVSFAFPTQFYLGQSHPRTEFSGVLLRDPGGKFLLFILSLSGCFPRVQIKNLGQTTFVSR